MEMVGFTDDQGNDGWPWSSNSWNFLFSDEKTVLGAQADKGYREVRYEFETAKGAEHFAASIMDIPEYEQLNIVLDTTKYTQVKITYENIFHVVMVTLMFILHFLVP